MKTQSVLKGGPSSLNGCQGPVVSREASSVSSLTLLLNACEQLNKVNTFAQTDSTIPLQTKPSKPFPTVDKTTVDSSMILPKDSSMPPRALESSKSLSNLLHLRFQGDPPANAPKAAPSYSEVCKNKVADEYGDGISISSLLSSFAASGAYKKEESQASMSGLASNGTFQKDFNSQEEKCSFIEDSGQNAPNLRSDSEKVKFKFATQEEIEAALGKLLY